MLRSVGAGGGRLPPATRWERKRSVAAWPKLPRLSSTLPAHPGYRASRKPIKSRNGPARRALIRPKSHCELVAPGQGRRFTEIAGVRKGKGTPHDAQEFCLSSRHGDG